MLFILTLQAHVYHLMKSDSYSRYLRSEMYKDFLNGSKKKVNSFNFSLNFEEFILKNKTNLIIKVLRFPFKL